MATKDITLEDAVRIRQDPDSSQEERDAADEVYFEKLGEVVEQNPIGFPPPKSRTEPNSTQGPTAP